MKVNYKNGRISVSEAAEMLDMTEETVRSLMAAGKLPIGIVDKSKKSERNNSYYIYKARVLAFKCGFDLISGNDAIIKKALKEILEAEFKSA